MPNGLAGLAAHMSPLVIAFGVCVYVGHRQHKHLMRELAKESLPRPAGDDPLDWTPSEQACAELLAFDKWRQAEDVVALAYEAWDHHRIPRLWDNYKVALDGEALAAFEYELKAA